MSSGFSCEIMQVEAQHTSFIHIQSTHFIFFQKLFFRDSLSVPNSVSIKVQTKAKTSKGGGKRGYVCVDVAYTMWELVTGSVGLSHNIPGFLEPHVHRVGRQGRFGAGSNPRTSWASHKNLASWRSQGPPSYQHTGPEELHHELNTHLAQKLHHGAKHMSHTPAQVSSCS